ncbi:MFS transporter [Chloroflexi bacterium TSY]|nr:MFS transporter [Chloroflexi bacterium TSY]
MKFLTPPRGMHTFAIIWFGQLVSSLGSGLTGFGLGVWVFQETGSAGQFALTTFFYVLPMALIGSVAGTLVDRWNRQWVLILANTGQALSTLIIALLLFTDQLAVYHIYAVTIVSSVIASFQGPAYDASVALLVPKQQLGRAVGMAETSRAVSHLSAPLLAGWLIIVVGLPVIIFIDLATFLVAIVTLWMVRIPQPPPAPKSLQSGDTLWQEWLAGWHYLRLRPGLLGLTVMSALRNFPANAWLILTIPLVLSLAGPEWVGIVMAVGGAGLLVGGLVMSTWDGFRTRISGVVIFSLVEGIAAIVGGWSTSPLVIAVSQFVFWFGFAGLVASIRPISQIKTPPAMQARVSSIIGALCLLMEAPAYPIAGWLADQVFEPLMMQGGTLASLFGPYLGIGPGRGMGLIRVCMGLGLVLIALIGYAYPRIRCIEQELPDMLDDVVGEAATSTIPA